MFKIVAIICSVAYGGHMMECTRMEESDRRTFHTHEACIEEAGYKYDRIADILRQFPDQFYTLEVRCEPLEATISNKE